MPPLFFWESPALVEIGTYTEHEALMDEVSETGRPRAVVSRHEGRVLVLGRSSKPEVELYPARAAEEGVPILRRRGGGCSVLLDEGNLIVAVLLPLPGFGAIHESFRRISAWLSERLAEAGIPGVTQEGVSDLALDGRKIGGSCIYRRRGLLYYSTTLLVEPDLDAMERLIAHPPREPEYRAGRRHRDFVRALSDAPWGQSTDALHATLTELLPAEPTALLS